jgi:hypothetical protein
VVDLPVGKGKRLLHGVNRFLDALVGDYQVAFVGQVLSQSFQVAAANWGAAGPIQNYGSSVPITDCRSGACHPEYLWFNGYIAPTVINAAKNGISGIPANYTRYEQMMAGRAPAQVLSEAASWPAGSPSYRAISPLPPWS